MNVNFNNFNPSELSFGQKIFVSLRDGAIHGYAITFAVAKGFKIATAPISIPAYMLVHLIKNAVTFSVDAGFKWGENYISGSENPVQQRDASILRKFTWKVAGVGESVLKKVDGVYSWTFGIHTAEQAKNLPNTQLYTTELIRKLFWLHVKEQITYFCSWEIGIRGSQLLLKCTILTFAPSTVKIYALRFLGSLSIKVYMAHKMAEVEQQQYLQEKLPLLFQPAIEGIREHYQALELYCQKGVEGSEEFERQLMDLFIEKNAGLDSSELSIEDREELLQTRLNKSERIRLFEQILDDFKNQVFAVESDWQCYSTDLLKDTVGQYYKFIQQHRERAQALSQSLATQYEHLEAANEFLFEPTKAMIETHFQALENYMTYNVRGSDEFERQLVELYLQSFGFEGDSFQQEELNQLVELGLDITERRKLFKRLLSDFNDQISSMRRNIKDYSSIEFEAKLEELHEFIVAYEGKV